MDLSNCVARNLKACSFECCRYGRTRSQTRMSNTRRWKFTKLTQSCPFSLENFPLLSISSSRRNKSRVQQSLFECVSVLEAQAGTIEIRELQIFGGGLWSICKDLQCSSLVMSTLQLLMMASFFWLCRSLLPGGAWSCSHADGYLLIRISRL